MSEGKLKRPSHWRPAAMVAAVVVLTGARLVTLSAHERAAGLRVAAQGAVANHARLIETELDRLLQDARGEARRAARAPGSVPLLSLVPRRNAFWMTDTGTVLRAGDADPTVSRALAGEWALASPRGHGAAEFFGPVRYGSQWFVAAQTAIDRPAMDGTAASRARVVVYEGLDALLLRAHFGQLVQEGYDFDLRQRLPLTPEQRVFHSSGGHFSDAVSGAITAPGTLAPQSSSAYLELAIRPRTGWYPARFLATGIGLVAVLAWLLAWGTHDMTHSLSRAQAALATARGRLRGAQARLVAETEKYEALRKNLEHARYHDPSTGLPNRRYFMDQLDRALREMRTGRLQSIAVGLIHIDRFTLINDTLGHTAGDELLLHAAQRFEKVLGESGAVLARWGSGQLALLVYPVESAAGIQDIASDLQRACQEPFALRKHRVRIATHIGYTCIDSGLHRTEEVLREADIALSVANQQKGPLAVGYTPGMGGAAMSLIGLEADLHIALDRHEFGLLYQPIVDLRGGRAVGVETLLRWQHPVQGLLTPDKFLAIAEEAGVIVPVTHWVIERSCRLAAAWRQRLPADSDFYISVNLSAAALSDPGLHRHVARVLEVTRTPPRYLKLELTEGGLINNVRTAREVLDAFHGLGVELMLDDFGTGNSSLSDLQRFPFDYVKIDQPFVNRTGSERANTAITAAIVQMASSLGLRAVAEVVENQAAAQALTQMGCTFGQGYYFSEPVEAEIALEQLRSHTYPTAIVPTISATALERNATTMVTTLTATESGAVAPDDCPTQLLPEPPTLASPYSPTLKLRSPASRENGADADEAAPPGRPDAKHAVQS
ncbi:MAG TPA: bifunctional diguanylate cyclase/phosphodiesterase [Steroidobacteraceae bacterium]|nr:bifunctional diguanylate cyclase/phosphodiesterase [Steroidobacteraceae bacterium]